MSSTDNVDPKADSSNDEVMRKCLKPDPSNEQVLQAISTTYKHPISNVKILTELESYDDRNYLVELSGKKYLAKIYNGVESAKYIICTTSSSSSSLSSIHLYSEIFNHLSKPQYDITTSYPLAIPDTPSSTIQASVHSLPVTSKEPTHNPCNLVLQLLEWVEGTTMASVPSLPVETLIEAGQYLGKICTALDDLTNTNDMAKMMADRYHAWDGKNTLDLQSFVHCIGDERRRALVQSVLDEFRETFMGDEDKKPVFRKGILMADFNDANIILDGKGTVSGVIDFGDTTLSWRVLDVSVAMAYAMMSSYGKGNRGISAAAAILRGFHSTYPLTNTERKYLRLLMASRISCSATLGAYSYQQNPQNEYLLLHAQPAWNALELVWGSGDETISSAINQMFDIACDAQPSDILKDCADICFPDPSIVDVFSAARASSSSSSSPSSTTDPTSSEPLTKRAKVENDGSKPVITFVTGNKKKLEEVKRILSASSSSSLSNPDEDTSSLPFTISNLKIDLPELQGDPLEIAKEKCALAAKEVGGPVITEDTSLCFTALSDMPGPYIKWFLDKCGHDGLNDMIAFSEDKSGYAQTVVGFCAGPGEDVIVFDGRTMGTIVRPRGSLDFGWDPIFQPDEGGGLTYAEMAKEAKDAISHRGRSFGKFRSYLLKEAETLKKKIAASG